MPKIAIAQFAPVFNDKQGALDRCCEIIDMAGAAGADVIAFPESWLGGYPAWCFGAADWSTGTGDEIYAEFLRSSFVVGDGSGDGDLAPVAMAARTHGITVVIGLNERAEPASGTVFNAMVTIGGAGQLLNHHRKLNPTYTEKNVWAPGDAAGLRVVETAAGRIGGLVCWEHWNPLARQVLHAGSEQIHVAAWPDLSEMHQIASRSYAFEGRCFVVVAANIIAAHDLPDAYVEPFRHGLDASWESGDGYLFNGGSGVIDPWGQWVCGPAWDGEKLVVADMATDAIEESQYKSDIAGHYQRADLFRLQVRSERTAVHGVEYSCADRGDRWTAGG